MKSGGRESLKRSMNCICKVVRQKCENVIRRTRVYSMSFSTSSRMYFMKSSVELLLNEVITVFLVIPTTMPCF